MNWPVLKDIRWLILQSTSILFAVIGVFLAVANNGYWVICLVLSSLLLSISVARVSTLTKG